MKLIIVESPTKARTLSRFLGNEYRIEASMGHVRDLPKSTLGVDLEHNFEPSYLIPRDKTKQVNDLKSAAKNVDSIILATDPDREGEAIAWHVASILSDDEKKKNDAKAKTKKTNRTAKSFVRIAFHEITESAINEALEHPGVIDMKLVDAQQARRVLDRLVGYKLSPLLWQKLSKRWLSAGRVQSVVVRLIVEREREIGTFESREYWTIDGDFLPSKDAALNIRAHLVSKDGVKYEKTLSFSLFDGVYTTSSSSLTSAQETQAVIADLAAPFSVRSVAKKEVKRSPPPPYTTSTLQQDAGRKLYFSSKRTMQIAQKLYEEGYITYHRTDSVNLSEKFLGESRAYITATHGKDFVPKSSRVFKTKSKVAQEAHEAIRPTKVSLQSILNESNMDFNKDHVRLYELIWKRAMSSQAADAIFDSTTIIITSSNGYEFQTNGSVVKFEGFLRIAGHPTIAAVGEEEEVVIPDVTEGQAVELKGTTPTQHNTNPPPRYTEASLVKTLEEKGIGRPSTYAPIITTIIDRQYVTREEKKLVPTELGMAVTDFLVQYFPNILELPFTAHMEDDLDSIANGEKAWQPVIADFYGPFAKALESTYTAATKVKLVEEKIDEKCPTCGHDLVVRSGRYGKFIACTNFPECKYTRQYGEKIDIPCPRCGSTILVKKSKKGKMFYGCSNYPTCTFAAWKKEDIK